MGIMMGRVTAIIESVQIAGSDGVFRRGPLIRETSDDGRCSQHSMKFLSTSLENNGQAYRRVDLFYCQYCLYQVVGEYTEETSYRPWWYVRGSEQDER